MTRMDLVETVIEKTGLNKELADDVVYAILKKVSDSLLNQEMVKLHGVGTLVLFEGKERFCRNVVKGEPLKVPPKTRVRFITSGILKKKLKKLDERKRE
jgi:nucleoid DNA-binding protein